MNSAERSVRSIDIEWGPTIDAEGCTGCGTCIDFCKNDVYRWSDDESKVVVGHKTHCVTGCSHCATLEELKRARRGA